VHRQRGQRGAVWISGRRKRRGASIAAIPPGSLNATEAADILYLREEEKLARDTYNYFYGLFGAQVFLNIAGSEQTHMDAVATLIERYGLDDPARPNAGELTNATLQAMYDRLTAEGSASQRLSGSPHASRRPTSSTCRRQRPAPTTPTPNRCTHP